MAKKRTNIVINDKAILSSCKTLKSKNDIDVPVRGRKSLKTKDRGVCEKIEVTPSLKPLSVIAFLPLVGLLLSVKRYIVGLGVGSGYFSNDMFIVLCCVGSRRCFSSVSSIVVMMYALESKSLYRLTSKRLELLLSYGLVSCKFVKGVKYYSISIDAENLIKKYVGVQDLRALNKMVKDVL